MCIFKYVIVKVDLTYYILLYWREYIEKLLENDLFECVNFDQIIYILNYLKTRLKIKIFELFILWTRYKFAQIFKKTHGGGGVVLIHYTYV